MGTTGEFRTRLFKVTYPAVNRNPTVRLFAENDLAVGKLNSAVAPYHEFQVARTKTPGRLVTSHVQSAGLDYVMHMYCMARIALVCNDKINKKENYSRMIA